MGYCTVSDVGDMFKSLTIGATTAVTTSKVQSLIDAYSAKIDGRVAKLYEVPVTGTNALAILKLVCLHFVVAELEPIVGQAVQKEGVKTREQSFFQMAEQDLAKIEIGSLDLVDATRKTTSTFSSGNVKNCVEPVFRKDRRQW